MGDTITMQLMKREKGVLVALPKSKWVNVDHPINLGGKQEGGRNNQPLRNIAYILIISEFALD